MPNQTHITRGERRVAPRFRPLLGACVLALLAGWGPRAARSDDASQYSWTPWNPCPSCDLLVGIGTTFKPWSWTDGLVVPLTLEIDDSRWELGAYRFATAQYLKEDPPFPESFRSANPQWGFDALRRWQVLRRPWGKVYLGFGGSYQTQNDWLDYRWNFAYLVGYRVTLGGGSILELSLRHWSNAWFRAPNRGQTFLMLSFGL
jgi:hypothetical protein